MSDRINRNTQSGNADQQYWNERFVDNGSWDAAGGQGQTRSFAEFFHERITIPYLHFSMLDVGCALGDAMPIWHANYPYAELSGCDVSEVAIERCTHAYGNMASFFTAGIDNIDGFWDIIYCSNVLEHLDDPVSAARILLGHCSELYVMTPYREYILESAVEHKYSLSKHSFDALLNTGHTISIESLTLRCPGPWGPIYSTLLPKTYFRERLIPTLGSLIKRRNLQQAMSYFFYPRQIIFAIKSSSSPPQTNNKQHR